MTYEKRSAQLALDASIVVQIALGDIPGDVEFIPLKPQAADAEMWADIKARWPGRGLRSIGIIGLVGSTPQCALKEPLDSQQMAALAAAFSVYTAALFADSFMKQSAAAEVAELERLYVLEDPRAN